MTANHHNKPAIAQAGLRVLLFCLAFFGLLSVVIFALDKLMPGHAQEKGAGPESVPYLTFIVTGIVSFAVVWIFRKFIDRASFSSLGFDFEKNGRHAGTGFFLGLFILCAGSSILFFSHNLLWTDVTFSGRDMFISFGLMVIVAFYEEVVFRGYILGNLMPSMNKWIALPVSALIFALAHLANPDFSITAAVNIFLAGLLLGANYIYTKNLWFSIMLHFAWNFFQGPILGYYVSGLHLQSLLQHELKGSELLTGGKFGFEGSLIATLLFIITTGTLVWVYEKKYSSWPAKITTDAQKS